MCVPRENISSSFQRLRSQGSGDPGREKADDDKRRANPAFPLRELFRCATCGGPLTASFSRSKTGKRYPYFFCFKRGCLSVKSTQAQVLEGQFLSLVRPTPTPPRRSRQSSQRLRHRSGMRNREILKNAHENSSGGWKSKRTSNLNCCAPSYEVKSASQTMRKGMQSSHARSGKQRKNYAPLT